MSQFKSIIPVAIEAFRQKLPARSFIESVTFNRDQSCVEVVWNCDDLRTGYTFAVEVEPENIAAAVEKYGVKRAPYGSPVSTPPEPPPTAGTIPRRKVIKPSKA